jgi:hypothetical protein
MPLVLHKGKYHFVIEIPLPYTLPTHIGQDLGDIGSESDKGILNNINNINNIKNNINASFDSK